MLWDDSLLSRQFIGLRVMVFYGQHKAGQSVCIMTPGIQT